MEDDLSGFKTACRELNLDLDESRLAALLRHAELIRDWNARINLVSRKDADRILNYHVVDSLAAARYLPPAARACDIGSGAGLPGIPLAIARPDTQIVLLESSGKKAGFLTSAVEELALANATVINQRAEETAPLDCDVVLSRATGPLRRVLKQADRHRRKTGIILFFKSAPSVRQFDRVSGLLERLHLTVLRDDTVVLPLTGIPRRFVVVGSACR
jgi:16S rRNA (guanine527-N7)-methyltransferase